eukprot:528591-Rhodomonas_salina.1
MDNAIPPSAAALPDALASLLQDTMPFPTDNGCDDDFVDEKREGNEVVQLLGGEGPDRDYPDLLDQGVAGLAEVPVPENPPEISAAGRGRGRGRGRGSCRGSGSGRRAAAA